MENKGVKPFLKWAGGKSQLLNEIKKYYPFDENNITKYAEPFVGGGAVLFDILENFHLTEVLINDINAELMNTYVQVRDNVDLLTELLYAMQNEFWKMDDETRKEYYYDKRSRFNYLKKTDGDLLEQAAIFVFLNKTCFNGLYRVNRKGDYNVPMGAYKKPLICNAENLKQISNLMQGVIIKCGDYSDTYDFIDEHTFVYIDPPYRPLTETASFTSYANVEFGDKEQIRLCNFIDKITAKSARVAASNSDPKNADKNDDFFDDLYRSYNIARVSANRMINSRGSRRGSISELLISNC